MRDSHCPICGSPSAPFLQFQFGKKLDLPTAPEIRFCAADNFAYLTGAQQSAYDAYYRTVVNDYRHHGTAPAAVSPMILQKSHLLSALPGYFAERRHVLDYGCGEADLIMALAREAPSSNFLGYDPSASVETAAALAASSGLSNVGITGMAQSLEPRGYDLIIASHVFEHIVDFDAIATLGGWLADDGLLYVEVPDAVRYEVFARRPFLGYFDRIHVNHFSARALVNLLARYGFTYRGQLQYAFAYPDGGEYPALGMLFGKGPAATGLRSPALREPFQRYVGAEQARARQAGGALNGSGGVLVWGAGDNFYRSMTNGGPLSYADNIVLLDRRPQDIEINGKRLQSMNPEDGIRRLPYPVVVTVTESGRAIAEQIAKMDPARKVVLI